MFQNAWRLLFQLVSFVYRADHFCAYVVHVPLGFACASTSDDKYIERNKGQEVITKTQLHRGW